MVAPELNLTKKVTADKEGAGPHHCQGLWLEEHQKSNPEDSTFCPQVLKLMETQEAVQAVRRLHRMEERQSRKTMKVERESERSFREP